LEVALKEVKLMEEKGISPKISAKELLKKKE